MLASACVGLITFSSLAAHLWGHGPLAALSLAAIGAAPVTIYAAFLVRFGKAVSIREEFDGLVDRCSGERREADRAMMPRTA